MDERQLGGLFDKPTRTPREDAIARKIIGAGITVHRTLGPGFVESVYEQALAIELELRGIPFQRQLEIDLEYRGQAVGCGRIDLLVGNLVVVELKCVQEIHPRHVAQTLSYLKATRLQLGLILNFGADTLRQGTKRVILCSPDDPSVGTTEDIADSNPTR